MIWCNLFICKQPWPLSGWYLFVQTLCCSIWLLWVIVPVCAISLCRCRATLDTEPLCAGNDFAPQNPPLSFTEEAKIGNVNSLFRNNLLHSPVRVWEEESACCGKSLSCDCCLSTCTVLMDSIAAWSSRKKWLLFMLVSKYLRYSWRGSLVNVRRCYSITVMR